MGSAIKSVVAPAASASPWGTAALVGGQVLGGILGSRAASKQAAAMNQQAAAQVEAARIAAEEARFRPVGITTRFSSATPQFDEQGRLTGYGYQATPEITGLQDQLAGLYGASLGQAGRAAALQPQFEQAATGLFGLGQQYMAQTPEELRQRYMQQQMDVLRPYDIEEEQRLAAGVFGRGRGGLSVGAGGQPELQALAESRRRRDLQLAAQAEQASQQQLGFGAGLFGQGAGLLGTGYQTQQAALAPFQSQFGMAQQLEEVAQSPMQIGAALGGKSSQFGGVAGQMLMGGQQAASNLQSAAAQAKAAQLAGFGQGIAGAGKGYYQDQLLRDIYGVGTQSPAPIIDAPVTVTPRGGFVQGPQGSTNYGWTLPS